MFHFGTNHNQERRDGFVSSRCFLWLGGWRRGEDFEKKRRMGEDERGRKRVGTGIGGWERTKENGRWRGEDGDDGHGTRRRRSGEDFERRKEDGEDWNWNRR